MTLDNRKERDILKVGGYRSYLVTNPKEVLSLPFPQKKGEGGNLHKQRMQKKYLIDSTSCGTLNLLEWLKKLDPEDRKIVGDDLQALEFGWPIGMPLCRAMRSYKGLWELRSDLNNGRIARVLFSVSKNRLILLQAFIKKTRKTPLHDLKIAVQRMKGNTS